MSSTEISSLADYNPSSITTRCGEIYCSENLDSFSIHCATCPQQFYLLSCTLFIKHIKECKTMGFENLTEQNIASQETYTYTIDNLLNDESISNEIDIEETTFTDPLMNLKLEIARDQDEPQDYNEPTDDLKYQSDFMDEDELSPKKGISRTAKIQGIIDEYRKHPILWDPEMAKSSTNSEKKEHYKQISKLVNAKFKINLTYKELRLQILALRQEYKRVLKTKQSFSNDGNANFNPKLWYFDRLSFIQGSNDDIEVELSSLDETNPDIITKQEPNDSESSDSAEHNQPTHQFTNKKTDNCKVFNDPMIILDLIRQYKQYPFLWDRTSLLYNNKQARKDAYDKMTANINTKFNKNFSSQNLSQQILNLRSGYRRVRQKKKIDEDYKITLWYYDDLSFVDSKSAANEEDNSVVNEKDDNDGEKNAERKEIEITFALIELYKEQPCLYNNTLYNTNCRSIPAESFTEIRTAINNKFNTQYTNADIKNIIWQLRSTYKRILRTKEEFEKLHANANKKFHPQWKYFDKLSFIGTQYSDFHFNSKPERSDKIEDSDDDDGNGEKKEVKEENGYEEVKDEDEDDGVMYDDEAEEMDMVRDDKMSVDSEDGESNENDLKIEFLTEDADHSIKFEELYANEQDESVNRTSNKESKVNSKELVFEFIDLYKTAPVLWNTNHHLHAQRKERRKAVQEIIEVLGSEYDCHLTIEEYHRQIRFLRDSYFRVLREENDAKMDGIPFIRKPFFFDRLSFLKPYAKTSSTSKANVAESDEKFTYLVENKPLMIDFIEAYKAHPCLWNSKDKDKNNIAAHSQAYDNIMNTFSKYELVLTKEQVLTAIRFLHSSYVKQKKLIDTNLSNNTTTSEPALIWFFDNLQFLTPIPKKSNKYCSHCDKHFQNLKSYEKHKIEIAGDYPYKCPVCNAGFISRSKYAYHQITHKEPHKCDQCDFQAFDKHNFEVHMRRHNGIYPFKCTQCEKGFVTSTEMHRHIRMHTGERPFICDICGKTLPGNSEFSQHMKRHKNQRDHKCDFCGSAFYTPKTLRDHMASHSNERKHICETCGAAFKRKKTLHQHKALHAEKKKHECKICGKMFAQKAGVYSHMKSHGMMNEG